MKYGLLTLVLVCSLATLGPQSGRVRRGKGGEKSPSSADLPFQMDASRPVLVNMKPEDFQGAGLDKLTEEELDHLDRWILDLFVKMQRASPGRTLQFEKSEEDQSRQRNLERQQQDLQARLMDLQSRLSSINREATRMNFDLRQAQLAASRGDRGSVQSALFGLESSVRRIQQASQ